MSIQLKEAWVDGCRWKQELEAIRKECTVLLRERYMLEQCIRYANHQHMLLMHARCIWTPAF